MSLASLIPRAFEKRRPLFGLPGTNCFRLCNGAGDGVNGLTVDLYGEYLLLQYFSPGLQRRTDEIRRALDLAGETLPLRPEGILLKDRSRQSNGAVSDAARSVIIDGTGPPAGYAVLQNGVRAAVDLVRGQSTGVFLDMREVRDELAAYYRPEDLMLNLFSYTALFSVHAVSRGITGAVNVDLSRAVLEKAKTNYALNGLRYDARDFIYGDSIDWMRRFKKKGKRFSFIIFDPPTFSRNRRRTFSTRKDYRDSLSLLEDIAIDGLALTSVNSSSVTAEQYRSFHPKGWEIQFYMNESSDFPHAGEPYLKAGLWRIKKS